MALNDNQRPEETLNRASNHAHWADHMAGDAHAYFLSAYHSESPYFVEVALARLAEARDYIIQAEAEARAYLAAVAARNTGEI